MILALVMATRLSIHVSLDLTPLLAHAIRAVVYRDRSNCRDLVGYEIIGDPEDVVIIKRRKYQIGPDRVMLLLASSGDRLVHRGRTLEIGTDLDPFGFAMVDLGDSR